MKFGSIILKTNSSIFISVLQFCKTSGFFHRVLYNMYVNTNLLIVEKEQQIGCVAVVNIVP